MATDTHHLDEALALLERTSEASALCTGTTADPRGDVILVTLDDGRTGRLPATEMVPGKRPEAGQTLILAEIEPGTRPLLSATCNELLPLLLDGLVPELRDGSVRVMGVARRVGVRAKIAVAATREDVDPVGSILGRGAGRLKVASRLLNGERIDVVAWHPDPAQYAVNALAVSPLATAIDPSGTVRVTVPSHQLQAALGGGRLNVSLASQLIGARIAVEGP